MTEEPVVSVILPVYNASAFLKETMNCVLAQSWHNMEVIIIDDGSTDDSLQIAHSFQSDKIKIFSQPNRGGNAARNKGLSVATGDYIQFWDADDLMDPEKIEVQLRRLRNSPKETVAFCPWYRFHQTPGDANHGVSPNWRDFDNPVEWIAEYLKGRAMMPLHGWLVPREVIERAGRWDESLTINQDGEFFTRVVLKATALVCCPDVNVYYRSGLPNSVSQRNSDQGLRSLYYSMTKILDHVLTYSDDTSLKSAAACYLQKFIRSTYPYIPDTLEEAKAYLKTLGKCPKDESFGKKPTLAYRLLEQVIGWKNAADLKRMIRG